MVIYNADIRTMTGRNYPNGYIQIMGKTIAALGSMEDCPDDPDRLDAGGRIAMPGLIDAHCHIGMWEDGLGFEGDDGNEDTDPCTPHLRGLDAVNPLDRAFIEAIDYGVTTVVTGPGSANPVAGQMCALKTCGRRVDDMIVREPLAIKFAMGENPKNSYHEKQQGPATRMMVAAIIREQLWKAKKYLEQLDEAAADDELAEPDYDAKCEALLPLLRGEIQAHFHAHRADDIFTAIRIAQEFALEYVIVHGTAGHLVAAELAEIGAPIICGPMMGARTKPELVHFSEAGAGALQKAGTPVAICTDHPEMPARYLLMSAQLAADAGMEPDAALAAITSGAAKILRLEDRVGALAVGLDADILLYDDEPMRTHGKPWAVWIDGKKVR